MQIIAKRNLLCRKGAAVLLRRPTLVHVIHLLLGVLHRLAFVLRVHDKRLVYRHEVYLRRRVAPPIVVRRYAVPPLEKERELLG